MSSIAEVPADRPPRPLRARIVAAALAQTGRSGWSSVTMGRLASDVGVSRQTVYNEIGSKRGLAEAMVAEELLRFLGAVQDAFDDNGTDVHAGIRAAVLAVLRFAEDHPVLRSLAGPGSDGEQDVLPLLTSRSASLLTAARQAVLVRLAPLLPGVPPAALETGVDAVVRLVLSHVVQPGGDAETSADAVTWVAVRLLDVPRPHGVQV